MDKLQRNKLEGQLAILLLNALEKEYHLRPREEFGISVIRQFINNYKMNTESARTRHKGLFINRAFNAYWRTTKLPKKEECHHSAYFFKNFLINNYLIIVIPKIFRK